MTVISTEFAEHLAYVHNVADQCRIRARELERAANRANEHGIALYKAAAKAQGKNDRRYYRCMRLMFKAFAAVTRYEAAARIERMGYE
jgi:hypothetical protein